MSLNSKKSWHPGKAINRAKVAKLEEDKERRLNEASLKSQEVDEERELARLRQVAEGQGGEGQSGEEPRSMKLEWMYKTKEPSIVSYNDRASLIDGAKSADSSGRSSDIDQSLRKRKDDLSISINDSDNAALDKLNARKAAIDPLAEILSRYKTAKKTQNGIRKTNSLRRK